MPWAALLCLAVYADGFTPAIDQWVRDIEATGAKIYVANVRFDPVQNTIHLNPGVKGFDKLAPLLQRPDFVRQLMPAQALTVSQRTETGFEHLIFVNEARLNEYKGHEDALLGHELGHAWVTSQGYVMALYNAGPNGCLSIHAADAVQHILIRRELERRGINAFPTWTRTLDIALAQWREHPLPDELPSCERLQAASQWIDVRLGMPEGKWAGREEFEKLLAEKYPEMQRVVLDLCAVLSTDDVADRQVYREKLGLVVRALSRLADPTTSLKINQ